MIFEIFLTLHIIAGFLSLITAISATFAKVFNVTHKWHLYSGRLFCVGMLLVFLTAIPVSIITKNVFLLLIAIFSGYLVLSGWCFATNRKGTPTKLDWFRVYLMFLSSLAMLIYSINLIALDNSNGITLLVFAVIGGSLSIGDIKILRQGGIKGKERIARHLGMMLAGTIATITAFVVVNFSFEPAYVLWLAPTVVITPIIILWSNKVRKGFAFKDVPSNLNA